MYSRWNWTRDQEDAERLPYGMVRTAYDADTRQFTFLDTTTGDRFVSAPGEAYGTLVPAATANFPKASRSHGRSRTLQAYDRPVYFADDPGNQQRSSSRSKSPSMGHKRTPTMPPSSSRHHSTSSSTRKQGRKRSASFSDFLPPHLIARASNSPVPTAVLAKPEPKVNSVRSAPPSPVPYGDEKKSSGWRSSSPTEPLLQSLPTLLAGPPPLPPKDYPVSSPQQQGSDGTCAPRVAVRLAARMFGRTTGAVKSGQRSPEGHSDDKGWVVV